MDTSAAADLCAMTTARRVAVVGATDGSGDPQSYGARVTRNLLESEVDEVVLVNPRRETIFDRPCVPDLAGRTVDLAVLVVPARRLVSAARDAARAGARGAIVISAGATAEDRAELAAIRRESGMRIVGPNCVGFVSRPNRLWALAGRQLPQTVGGRDGVAGQRTVGVISQSGGSSMILWGRLAAAGVPVSHVFSTGDELDLTAESYLAFLLDDAATTDVLMFIESPRDPAAIRALAARAADAGKRLVAIKIGRGEKAQELAASHTGAVAGEWAAFGAAMRADGAIVAGSVRGACDAVAVTAAAPPGGVGDRVAVLTNSGGTASLAVDLMEPRGLRLAGLDADLSAVRSLIADPGIEALNPLDTAWAGGTPRVLEPYLDAIGRCGDVDVLVGMFGGAQYDEFIAERFIGLRAQGWERPIALVWPGIAAAVRERLQASGILVFDDAADLFAALSRVVRADRTHRAAAAGAAPARRSAARRQLTYDAALGIVAGCGVPTPGRAVLPVEAGDLGPISGLRPPLIVKTAKDVAHKADLGGVIGPVDDPAGVPGALRLLRDRGLGPYGVVEEAVPEGFDLVVDLRRSELGLLVSVGFGGPFADSFPAEALLCEPWDDERLRDALTAPPLGAVVAKAARAEASDGAWPGEPARLVRALERAVRAEGIEEIEINPLRLAGGRFVALDAKVWVPA